MDKNHMCNSECGLVSYACIYSNSTIYTFCGFFVRLANTESTIFDGIQLTRTLSTIRLDTNKGKSILSISTNIKLLFAEHM